MDYTDLLAVTFVCSLVVGLFIRALDHVFKSLIGKQKRSTVMD